MVYLARAAWVWERQECTPRLWSLPKLKEAASEPKTVTKCIKMQWVSFWGLAMQVGWCDRPISSIIILYPADNWGGCGQHPPWNCNPAGANGWSTCEPDWWLVPLGWRWICGRANPSSLSGKLQKYIWALTVCLLSSHVLTMLARAQKSQPSIFHL